MAKKKSQKEQNLGTKTPHFRLGSIQIIIRDKVSKIF